MYVVSEYLNWFQYSFSTVSIHQLSQYAVWEEFSSQLVVIDTCCNPHCLFCTQKHTILCFGSIAVYNSFWYIAYIRCHELSLCGKFWLREKTGEVLFGHNVKLRQANSEQRTWASWCATGCCKGVPTKTKLTGQTAWGTDRPMPLKNRESLVTAFMPYIHTWQHTYVHFCI